jgi:hypothetical protein
MPNTNTDDRLTEGLRVNVDATTLADVERLAAVEDRSVAAVIRRAIKRELAAAREDGRL